MKIAFGEFVPNAIFLFKTIFKHRVYSNSQIRISLIQIRMRKQDPDDNYLFVL